MTEKIKRYDVQGGTATAVKKKILGNTSSTEDAVIGALDANEEVHGDEHL